jgi:DNA-binding NarL/FixJ family response regulator
MLSVIQVRSLEQVTKMTENKPEVRRAFSPEGDQRIHVAAYAISPVAAAGLTAILDKEDDFSLSAVFPCLDLLEAYLGDMLPKILLLELNAEIGLEELRRLVSGDPGRAVILWYDSGSSEFFSQAISLGVTGVLCKQSSIEQHLECFRTVAAGHLWIEHEMRTRLQSTNKVALTPRQRQIMGLIAQGVSNREIAGALGIKESTVKVYLSILFDKAGAADRFELALIALKNIAMNQTVAAGISVSIPGQKAVSLYMPEFLVRPMPVPTRV